ncbi:DUF6297 family protein [Micromonospora sp. M12]
MGQAEPGCGGGWRSPRCWPVPGSPGVACALGPLLVTPATQSWATSAPVDRRAWLAPRFVLLLLGAAAGTAALGWPWRRSGRQRPGDPGLGDGGRRGMGCGGAGAQRRRQSSRSGRRWPTLVGAVPMVAAAVITALVVLVGRLGDGLPRPATTPTVALFAAAVPLVGWARSSRYARCPASTEPP